MPDRVLRVFLDTNAFSYLIEWSQADAVPIRERLVRATKRGLVRVEGSLEVFGELAGTVRKKDGLFRRVSDLAFTLVDRWWMLPLKQRYILEVGRAGKLSDDGLYMARDLRRKLKCVRERASEVLAVADEVRERAEEYQTKAERERANVIARLGTDSGRDAAAIREAMWSWWKEGPVADWCRDMLHTGVERGLIAPADDGWHDPKSLAPSLWNYMSYRLLRIALEVGEGRRIEPSDEYDSRHYSVAATYADMLVTDDRRFRTTREMLGEGRLEVVGLLQLDARIKDLLAEAGGGDCG